jgi:RNA polymerase primary sigma factor
VTNTPDGITKLPNSCPKILVQTAPRRACGGNRSEIFPIANAPAAAEGAEEVQLDLTPDELEKNNDPVYMYFREMGTVSLLKREGEVAIAKRIERGQVLVLKALSRSPIVLKELLATGEELRKGTYSIKEIVRFDHEELTEEKIKNKTRQILRIIDKIDKLHQVALKQAAKLVERTPRSKKRTVLRAKYHLARTRIEMSRLVCSIDFNPREKKWLIERMRHAVEQLHSLEREMGRLERRADAAGGDTGAKVRKELRSRRYELKEIEESSEVGLRDLTYLPRSNPLKLLCPSELR